MPDHKSRVHALLSASSSERWLRCPPSAAAATAYPEQSSPYAEEGTRAHEVAEVVASGLPLDADTPGVTSEMIRCAMDYADYINSLKAENDATVLLEQRVDFSPWVPQGFGTCDCIILQGSTLIIVDYKYGMGVPVSAEDNPQLKLYALGALYCFGDLMDIDQVELHIFQPRLDHVSKYSLSYADLMAWAETVVRPTAEMASQGKGTMDAGMHCRWCPHAGVCPELQKACMSVVELGGGLTTSVPHLMPEEVARVLQWEPLITLWLKRVKDTALADLLDGKDVPGYKVVEGKLGNRKWTDERAVVDTLKDVGYSLEDITETKLLSPSGMDKAIGKKKAAELLSSLINRAPGAPTVVPISDKRPPLDRVAEARRDFE